jgi:hypothetical protein
MVRLATVTTGRSLAAVLHVVPPFGSMSTPKSVPT